MENHDRRPFDKNKNKSTKTQERILKEFDASLARLQLSYVDVIQIHDFEFCQVYIEFNLDFVFQAWVISFGAASLSFGQQYWYSC